MISALHRLLKMLPPRRTVVLMGLVAILATQLATADEPARLKRRDSFLGVHFDFHAGEDCREIGKQTTPEMVYQIIDMIHPDYLQIDCKGHPGVSSYPTRVGHPAPGFVGDPLRVWRQATAERGVALFVHYSGVWDAHAVAEHPEWGAINADGKLNGRATSLLGPYADRLLIPQLRELAGEYGVDGAWVDGDCWAAVPDYSEPAVAAYRAATGVVDPPRASTAPHWHEFLQFHRQAFRNYLNHYVAEVKQTHPNFQICSNWAFSDHMPEPVTVPVDFLSGDYSPQNSVNSARLAARFLARQGTPWDLMAWSFTTEPDRRQKPAGQLQREAAVVLALGGGFQAYYSQRRDGSVDLSQMPVMAEVARFCRDRQQICHHAEMVPQIGLLFSTSAHYRRIHGLFSRDHSRLEGILQALLEGQQSVEIQAEHQLAGRMAEYPLIVVPEWETLAPEQIDQLKQYVQAGGSLLAVGPQSAALFADVLGADLSEGPRPAASTSLIFRGGSVKIDGLVQSVSLSATASPFGKLVTRSDAGEVTSPAASIARLGRGRIAATYFEFGRSYQQNPQTVARDYLNALVRELFPEPLVEVTGTHDVDVCVTRQRGQLQINLVNTSGPHRTASIQDHIQPVGPLTVSIRRPDPASQVRLEPAGIPLVYDIRGDRMWITVPSVAIHEVLVVQANESGDGRER